MVVSSILVKTSSAHNSSLIKPRDTASVQRGINITDTKPFALAVLPESENGLKLFNTTKQYTALFWAVFERQNMHLCSIR